VRTTQYETAPANAEAALNLNFRWTSG
jgi:hypothetical protein